MSDSGKWYSSAMDQVYALIFGSKEYAISFSSAEIEKHDKARDVSVILGIEFNLVLAIMNESGCTADDVLVNMRRLERNTKMNSEKALFRMGRILKGKHFTQQAAILSRKMGRDFGRVWPFVRYLSESASSSKPVLTHRTNGERIAYRSR